jgi:drug/metabolite transporter (DMT)-like permease
MTSESKHASAKDRHARDDGSIVAVIPYLTVLVCAVAGVYIAWRQGSAGGGQGAVVGGVALLVGALVRLALPARLVGLLGTRKRVTDVLTLAVLGAGLIIAGLVLPRALGPGRLVRGGRGVSLTEARQVS